MNFMEKRNLQFHFLTTPSNKITRKRSDITDMIDTLTLMNEKWEEQLQAKERQKETADNTNLSIIIKEEVLINKAIIINNLIIERGYESLALDKYERFWKLADTTSSVLDKLIRGLKNLSELLENTDII